MESLSSGVLIKLLDEMAMDETSSDCSKPPVLLQIRSIIPVLAEGNLWPNHGFYLKISDSSHAIYVALPYDQNEMILRNELQLGQYIHVQKLEMAHPVPLLKGLNPLPGKHPFSGSPTDLVLTEKFGKLNEKIGRTRWGDSMNQKKNSDILKEIQILRSTFVNKDFDSDSFESSSSCSISTRRSWNETEIRRIKNRSNASIVKYENKPIPRPRSACASPIRSSRYDSSDENQSCVTRRKSICSSSVKSTKSTNKIRSTSVPRRAPDRIIKPTVNCRSVNNTHQEEDNTLWSSSLSLNLVKLGKEVFRQREAAIVAAVEALEEACAAERLIKSLSAYSEIQSGENADLHPSIDKFLSLQNEFSQTGLIVRSLAKDSPLEITKNSSNGTNSIKEVLEIAIQRKKHATSWIKAAISFDLSQTQIPSEPEPLFSSETLKRQSSTSNLDSDNNIPKDKYVILKQRRKSYNTHAGSAQENVVFGRDSSTVAMGDLVNLLRSESRSWFLGYVEKYLDGLINKSIIMESNNQVAEMMCKFKRVNDWLDLIKDGFYKLNDFEEDACKRVRSKIYEVLMSHVERSAMALENVKDVSHD